ncbi:RNA helicase [Rhodoferax lacus]|uniref:RNA helicase n=1 Tax=Rhodoferax lacus TaxID=2184758 RepID=A0A3E1RIP4_9BURK|nr:DEAD/DEAH box helicase [Rhodoferax lacus]RFO98470.1 RNA helicase [Rhodoferax lacus]
MQFSSLGLSPALLRALERQQLLAPTKVQLQAIPAVLTGHDAMVRAQTGSGKTLAYGLPLLHKLALEAANNPRQVRALVLVPTRELAVQVGETLRALANQLPQAIRISVVFGGVSINPQMLAMRGGTDVVVATPGRLLDLVQHNALSLSATQILVLDEADRLLDLGFEAELNRLLALLPQERQSLFFSATFAPAVSALAQSMLQEPVQIDIGATDQEKPDIAQQAILVDAPRRTQLLRHLITTQKWKRVLVFVATKHAAEIVADKLRKARIYAEPFHGELSQGKRSQVLSDFKASRLKVVIATDMASRGLDITQLPVVVNYDLPRSATEYTHRIGRTGRAGEAGLAVSFVSHDTEAHFRLIEKRHGLEVPMEVVEGFEPEAPVDPIDPTQGPSAAPANLDPLNNGGVKGKRPSKKDKLRAMAARQEQ